MAAKSMSRAPRAKARRLRFRCRPPMQDLRSRSNPSNSALPAFRTHNEPLNDPSRDRITGAFRMGGTRLARGSSGVAGGGVAEALDHCGSGDERIEAAVSFRGIDAAERGYGHRRQLLEIIGGTGG